MTPEESELVTTAKTLLCVPCVVWASQGHMPIADIARCCAWDHKKSGNIRRGHDKGFASCDWHHQRLVPDGWTHESMGAHFGPSLMDGSKLFARTYGTDDELIELQLEILNRLEAA